ncbi:MAG: twin-arginine translocation pathway signal [Gammaproteobacteria bacterium]|nr:twin-arginine translocation pathway signal [Gammaproteobacteria bacterium]MBU1504630.1 twin-arginine translocation pathway signal [Gammaproteobacteria bacterium]MBU2122659.1 twin-arginine translocation pathway signal [Gammaproteobacteria bacterium]MBU2172176.1 twin-arginine translocation pathway signal [Gammaproteobacteria bacterium]MBU2199071.1 twin-arginine translocation pathway signal [Gammaproteobacteria bacterium]
MNKKLLLQRRSLLLAAAVTATLTLAGCATRSPSLAEAPPVVFVHGNGDTAALWQTTVWRFESNGWPRERLHAIDVPYPLSRDDDSKAQPGRTSSAEHMAYLKAEVDKVLKATGARQVVLVGNSRGGNAIRNYIYNGGGDKTVSHAILGGTPNHGVWAIPGFREGNEFSGTGPFLMGLNAPKNAAGDEVSGPVKWMTIRSDNNDKFAQPDGLWIGQKGKPTYVTAAGPELKGATNVVIPRIDHRETSYSPAAFEASYRFITGKAPQSTTIAAEKAVVLNGKITGQGVDPADPKTGNFSNNLPLAGAQLEVYATDPTTGARTGGALLRKTVGADGQWGPLTVPAGSPTEFVITAPGYATTHIYRSGFPRSSNIIHLRAERISDADKGAESVVTLTRPRGYLDPARDKMLLDGAVPVGVPSGAGAASTKIKPSGGVRPITAEFNGERVTGQTWPAAQGRVVMLEISQ